MIGYKHVPPGTQRKRETRYLHPFLWLLVETHVMLQTLGFMVVIIDERCTKAGIIELHSGYCSI